MKGVYALIEYIRVAFRTRRCLIPQENAISRIIDKIADDLKAEKPTRAVLLIPIFEGIDGHRYETQARKAKFLEIGTFPTGSFCFVAPEASLLVMIILQDLFKAK